MKSKLSFNDVSKFIKKGNKDNSELIEDIDALSSLLILLSPFIFTCPATTALGVIGVLSNLLGVKDGVIQVSKRVFDKVTGKMDDDEIEQLHRMQVAYVLICYTAFFDSLNAALPDITKQLKLKFSEKLGLSKQALKHIEERSETDNTAPNLPDISLQEIELPHPANPHETLKDSLIPLYKELGAGFEKFLDGFALWEKADSAIRQETKEILKHLPEQAYERFEAQYFVLAAKYEDFFVWANFHEHQKTRDRLNHLSKYMAQHVELATAQTTNIDVGLARLMDLVRLIPLEVTSQDANKAIQELEKLYSNQIEEPVVKDSPSTTSKVDLTYPKKSEIFIPQAFQAIRYDGDQLEAEKTWQGVPVRNDIGTFLLGYFSSPFSLSSPLIILGHPGSGKSLLTNIIAARLIPSPYIPIRVSLRNIKADNEIAAQIEEQIKQDTTRDTRWASLADVFDDKPALVILDGYDELLQASGKVFSGYVGKVQKFQENEISLGRRPVRTIVTSRITLIDKADIPKGATIIRLQAFDKDRRNKWAEIWNEANKQYFDEMKVRPFRVPATKKLIALAEQPLLLLMLAIYDSEANQLRNSKELDQTILYDRLLRRFIQREQEKDEAFSDTPKDERPKIIEAEMERLGAAALGMFNRRRLHIKIGELNRDLEFFKLERQLTSSSGSILSHADLLLGSFFFIHETK